MSRRVVQAGLLLASVLFFGNAAWLHAKAELGQWLMDRAWTDAQDHDEAPAAPWPGARTRPVARLVVPDLEIDRLVMDGAELPNLAWGPGLERGENGHQVIAAHRDTHFRFLGDLATGQALELQTRNEVLHWRVEERTVIDARRTQIDLDAPGPLLTLVTCYPLDGLATGTPYRLIVQARPEGPRDAVTPPSSRSLAWAR